jgi:hypothetical protein
VLPNTIVARPPYSGGFRLRVYRQASLGALRSSFRLEHRGDFRRMLATAGLSVNLLELHRA